MNELGLRTWADILQLLLSGHPSGEPIADAIYKRINETLDERVAMHKQLFAEEGTQDFDAVKFVMASEFIQRNVDPGMIAGLAIAGIYRLARQK
jgi:hypothetical protein